MTKEEILIRSILGPIRGGVRTFACAVEITSRLLFEEDMAQDDILVTKHVYPEVARKTEKSYMAVARQLERMGNLCWDRLGKKERDPVSYTHLDVYKRQAPDHADSGKKYGLSHEKHKARSGSLRPSPAGRLSLIHILHSDRPRPRLRRLSATLLSPV